MKIAYYLPEKTISNADLVKIYPEWTEEKIFSKTGIASRHVTADGEGVLELAENAVKKLSLPMVSTPTQLISCCFVPSLRGLNCRARPACCRIDWESQNPLAHSTTILDARDSYTGSPLQKGW